MNKGVALRKRGEVVKADKDSITDQITANTGLTLYQKKFLNYLLTLDDLPNTLTKLIADSEIDKSTFYNWTKELEFIKAYNQILEVKDILDRPWIDKVNRDKAKQGDLGHSRLYYLRSGLLNTGNQVQTAIQINLQGEEKVG